MQLILTSLITLFPCVLASYILTPKVQNTFLFFNLELFNEEHNIEHFVTIVDLTLYKTNADNIASYKNTLSAFYEIEEEQEFKINDDFENNKQFVLVDSSDLPWHLGRITTRDLPLETSFNYTKCNTNNDITVNNIVIDTGIDIRHSEFEGRATWLGNFIDDDDNDGNSHGTHCAGLIGSKTYGICKDANLFAIKVLGSDGSGSTSSVISGINAAFKYHVKSSKNTKSKVVKTVVSMSLGGGKSFALNKAVQATLKDPNFYFAAAAGNENSDACNTSPASVKEIFTVMASDKHDSRAYFSNFGKCADIYSPGVDIKSTIPNDKTAVYSGSSMACPLLVGVLTHYINMYPELDMKEIKEKLLSEATKDHIKKNPQNTNDLLVYLERNY